MLEILTDLFKRPRPTDLEITWRGQKIFENFIETQVTPKDIYEIQRLHGYDVAAWVLYKALREKESFQTFSSFIESKKVTYSPGNKNILVMVIPHNPWATLEKNNSYQWELKNMVADAGFDFCIPEIPYRRSIFANAYYYQEILKRFPDRPVLFLTHGQSSLELRWMLEKTSDLRIDILGWLNLSGLLYGTSLPPSTTDWFLSARRYLSQAHPVLPEVSRSNSYCYLPPNLPKDFPLVSVLGFTPSKTLSFTENQRYRELKHWGPNDGYVTLTDYLNAPGVVWPIWQEGHYLDVDVFKKKLQASLHYLCSEAALIKSPQR